MQQLYFQISRVYKFVVYYIVLVRINLIIMCKLGNILGLWGQEMFFFQNSPATLNH